MSTSESVPVAITTWETVVAPCVEPLGIGQVSFSGLADGSLPGGSHETVGIMGSEQRCGTKSGMMFEKRRRLEREFRIG